MPIRRTLLLVVVLGTMALHTPSPAGAEVPGKPFTSTECESYSDSVARLYTAGLGRQPEQGGFDYWITEYSLGNWTFPGMAQFFVDSAEFERSYGALTQDGFIRQLYRNVLGREGESGGVTFWNQQMSTGMSRATVLTRFAESPENITNSGTVQPALGPFNDGRVPGPWRCGPSLTGSLFSLGDVPLGWIENTNPVGVHENAGCESSLLMPSETDLVFFYQDYGPGIIQASYIAPTPYGADRYLAKVRQALVDCRSFVRSDGWAITFAPLSFPSYGDDSVAMRITATAPDSSWVWVSDAVVVRDGVVATAVEHYGAFSVWSFDTQDWVELAVQRMAALPVGG